MTTHIAARDSTPTTATSASTTITSSVSFFPFGNLPNEIRLAIYKVAIGNLIAEAVGDYGGGLEVGIEGRPRYRSALALLHTNKSTRTESAHEMLPVVSAECKVCEAEFCHALGALYNDAHSFSKEQKLIWVEMAGELGEMMDNVEIMLEKAIGVSI